MMEKLSAKGRRDIAAAIVRHERARGVVIDVDTVAAHLAADPREPASELGALVEMVIETPKGRVEHAFAEPFPRLAYNDGGLIVAGGAYAIEGGALVNKKRKAEKSIAVVTEENAEAVAVAVARYTRDHWGQKGSGSVVRLRAADPRVLSLRLGELARVTYRTKKGADRALTNYEHGFSRPRPVVSHHAGGLVISGGVYRVEARGIVD